MSSALIPNLNGASRIYAVFGDPVAQVQTPQLVNPLFAAARTNIFAVPFHVPPDRFDATWQALAALDTTAGIGVTVPHKVAAAGKCATLTPTARAVGAVNAIQRGADGRMHGALFDGTGFVMGLGAARERLQGARVLMVGAGGAGRAIAHALADLDPSETETETETETAAETGAKPAIASLSLMDLDPGAVAFTAHMVNATSGRDLARAADPGAGAPYDVIINASPIGLKGDAAFPVPDNALRPDMLVADIAALSAKTPLLSAAQQAGATTRDGKDMLHAQIALIAGFAAGLPAGTPLTA